jgi:hypothetical protein
LSLDFPSYPTTFDIWLWLPLEVQKEAIFTNTFTLNGHLFEEPALSLSIPSALGDYNFPCQGTVGAKKLILSRQEPALYHDMVTLTCRMINGKESRKFESLYVCSLPNIRLQKVVSHQLRSRRWALITLMGTENQILPLEVPRYIPWALHQTSVKEFYCQLACFNIHILKLTFKRF